MAELKLSSDTQRDCNDFQATNTLQRFILLNTKPKICMSDSRVLPLCKWNLCSSGVLRSLVCYLATDVSGQPDCSIFKRPTVQKVPLKMGVILCPETSVATNVCCITFQKNKDVMYLVFYLFRSLSYDRFTAPFKRSFPRRAI